MTDNGLQSLRGYSSLAVLFYHSIAGITFITTLLFGWGYAGVELFFVISAYILTKKWYNSDYQRSGKFAPKVYFLRRAFRIWPLYWVLLPLFFIFCSLPVSWQAFAFLQDFSLSTFRLLPQWSLCVEELFYLALPLWVYLFKYSSRYALPMTIVFAGLSVAWSTWTWNLDISFGPVSMSTMLYYQFPNFAFAYALGSLAATRPPLLKFNPLHFLWILPPVMIWLAIDTSGTWFNVQLFPGTMVLASFVSYLVITNLKDMKFMQHRWSVWIGNLTYPIYLLGIPIEDIVRQYLPPSIYGNLWHAIVPPAVILGAISCRQIIELPFLRVGKWVERRWLKEAARTPAVVHLD